MVVRSSTPELLEVEASYGPNGSAPPAHFHPRQDEHFEVLEGVLRVRVEGHERELRRGQTLDIPRGSAHQMWNAADMPVRVAWQTVPRGRTDEWFRHLDALQRSGRLGRNGRPGLLTLAVGLTEYRDVFRLAARPRPVVERLLAALAALGRRRGLSAG